MTYSDESIRQLTESVNTLASVVAKNESRFRWFAVAFLCLTMLVFYMGFNMASQVQANIVEDMESDIDSLGKRIYQFFLEIEGEVKKEEEDVSSFLKDLQILIHNSAILSERAVILTDKQGPLAQGFAALNQRIEAQTEHTGIAEVLADIFILVYRLKLDSDSLRRLPNGKIMEGSGLFAPGSPVHQELTKISQILRGELRIINHTMGVMTHSVGPTMGRMGTMTNAMPMVNMIPW